MSTVAIIPARSGSKGLTDKNIRSVAGITLLERSIQFAKHLEFEQIIVTTDKEEYAKIARNAGAIVPGLRDPSASNSKAMEPAIIDDLNQRLREHRIAAPEIVVWLRPTFIFRSIASTLECVRLVRDESRSSARVVTEVDPRIYASVDGKLKASFSDGGASMIQRQGMEPNYHVFNADVFPWPTTKCPKDYLGSNIGYSVAPKICGVDIDTEEDLNLAEALLKSFGTGILA